MVDRDQTPRDAHAWGPWISNPKAFNGDPHRHCSCGLLQWFGDPDPHGKKAA